MRYISAEEAIFINMIIIKKLSPTEQIGVKDPHGLDSAINRPKQSAFGEDAYPTIHEKASALLESVAQNHVFQNANKRTALACVSQFYEYNGYELTMTNKYAEDFVVDVVNHKYNFQEITSILSEYSRLI